MAKKSFFEDRVQGVKIAFRGAWLLIRSESSIKIQVFIALIVTAAGFYFEISLTEWMIQTMAIGLVLGVEGINTAVEKLSDYVQPEYDRKIGFLKDISAGAVMLVSMAASIVGLLIYLPRLI